MDVINVSIDGIGLNASHFSSMTKEDAVKAMLSDGITEDKAWAEKAHALCAAEVKRAGDENTKKEKELAAAEKERQAAIKKLQQQEA